ncbi:hypothetical protein BaRGS_00002091 [Batillaria attramentaria]|uniref:Uncharacterized protein n=1 Tax=Batillaria attramentaria TaxID=370345 RepID=A0ABD0M4Z3_9CAEN
MSVPEFLCGTERGSRSVFISGRLPVSVEAFPHAIPQYEIRLKNKQLQTGRALFVSLSAVRTNYPQMSDTLRRALAVRIAGSCKLVLVVLHSSVANQSTDV